MHRPEPSIPDAALWRGSDVTIDTFAHDLVPDELAPLIAAASALTERGIGVEEAGSVELPLGPLAARVGGIRGDLMHGRGLALVRGFPVDELPPAVAELVVWGFGLQFGRPVSQSVMGERLGHITDVTATDPHARAYRNRSELTPHTDPADLLAFLCIRPAMEGGVSRFVSALTIHEAIRERRPDLLERLYAGFRYHRLGEQGPDDAPITAHRVPVFSRRDGVVSCRYVRQYIEVAADEDDDIDLDAIDREAMDLLEELAADPALHVEFTLGPGELVMANNFTVMHARSGFVDHSDPGRKRHLLRLWLATEPTRPVVPDILHFEGEPGIRPQSGRTPSYATDVEMQ